MAACLVAACAGKPKIATHVGGQPTLAEPGAGFFQVPPFARTPYAPFSREDAVAVALREWRLWGQAIDDDPPDTRPPRSADEKPERYPGLWQRVGEYWWTGEDSSTRMAFWTGKHDETGAVFPAGQDAHFAWSAAFISYVMRVAGAGVRFPYSAAHADYINTARAVSLGQTSGWAVSAQPPDTYAPQPGDLICLGRGGGKALTFADLPAASFPGHCDIVVVARPGELTVIGGNVDDTVTEKHIPTTNDGMLVAPGGGVIDQRYPWFVVLKVLYDQ